MSELAGLRRVVLRLARNPDAGIPDGDDHHGYVLMAPVDRDGMLDPALWSERKDRCTVRRFHPHEPIADGWLRRRGENWFFWYDEADEGPDEPVVKLGLHRLAAGEYVTVREADGRTLTFRIAEAVDV